MTAMLGRRRLRRHAKRSPASVVYKQSRTPNRVHACRHRNVRHAQAYMYSLQRSNDDSPTLPATRASNMSSIVTMTARLHSTHDCSVAPPRASFGAGAACAGASARSPTSRLYSAKPPCTCVCMTGVCMSYQHATVATRSQRRSGAMPAQPCAPPPPCGLSNCCKRACLVRRAACSCASDQGTAQQKQAEGAAWSAPSCSRHSCSQPS